MSKREIEKVEKAGTARNPGLSVNAQLSISASDLLREKLSSRRQADLS